LAAKGIIGLGAFEQLLEMKGDYANATKFAQIIKEYADYWMKNALTDDHYRM